MGRKLERVCIIVVFLRSFEGYDPDAKLLLWEEQYVAATGESVIFRESFSCCMIHSLALRSPVPACSNAPSAVPRFFV